MATLSYLNDNQRIISVVNIEVKCLQNWNNNNFLFLYCSKLQKECILLEMSVC